MKKCKKCNIEKEDDCFRFTSRKDGWSGYRSICKVCERSDKNEYRSKPEIKMKQKEYDKQRNSKPEVKEKRKEYCSNPEIKEKIKGYKKQYLSNPEVKEKIKEYNKRYSMPEHKEKRKERTKQRLKNDPIFKIKTLISISIVNGLKTNKGSKKGASCWKHLPYTKGELKQHLESLFEPWMTWENHGKYNSQTHDTNPTWNIDHIIPQSKFKYDSMNHPDFLKCWALENLRPLCAKQNVEDGNRR